MRTLEVYFNEHLVESHDADAMDSILFCQLVSSATRAGGYSEIKEEVDDGR